jgi:succinoglycan biosynthesis transport protein ExoP
LTNSNLTTLGDFVQVLRRRWWIVALVVVISLVSAYAYSKRQSPLYQASADVRLSAQPATNGLSGPTTPNAANYAVFVGNEALFATSPTVVDATMKAAHLNESVSRFLSRGSVSGDPTNAILTFSYDAAPGPRSVQITNDWATVYSKAATARDINAVNSALGPLFKSKARQLKQIRNLNAQGRDAEAQAQALVLKGTTDRIIALETIRQGINGNRQVSPANDSTKVRPRTVRNLVAGLGLGLILALVIMGVIEALDTRVRRSDEVGEVLGLPLLSRIPTPRRNQKGRLAMVDDDDQHYSEAYRKLRVNMDFANVRLGSKTIMVTSALEQEGKSTTVANLAVAMARTGRHVVLVDLDLRAPSLHSFFGLDGAAGLTEIALDHVHIEDALYHVPIVGASGRLDVVPVGSIPPRPADFLESPAIDAVLSGLKERADLVLIDSAPLLPVSDSIALSSKVDALLLVVASGLKRNVMVELQRALGACQATCLGFVLTGAERESDDYYGGYGRDGYGGGGSVPEQPVANSHRPVSVGEEGRVSRSLSSSPPGQAANPEPG